MHKGVLATNKKSYIILMLSDVPHINMPKWRNGRPARLDFAMLLNKLNKKSSVLRPGGGTVDAHDSKSCEETHESSILSPGTHKIKPSHNYGTAFDLPGYFYPETVKRAPAGIIFTKILMRLLKCGKCCIRFQHQIL